ncbi:MAG: hypothetical protein OXE74_07175 [Cyanobacteria bacterium MAG CAR2_bin_4]|nr:hypothetical protein [Cyanobacteria bacterium MAG CAR2_bin_4]
MEAFLKHFDPFIPATVRYMPPPPQKKFEHVYDARSRLIPSAYRGLLGLPLLMLLASCGGGGGGSSNNEELAERARQEVNVYRAIAQARPRPGTASVSQSSRTQNGITLDSVSSTLNSNGLTVRNDNDWSIFLENTYSASSNISHLRLCDTTLSILDDDPMVVVDCPYNHIDRIFATDDTANYVTQDNKYVSISGGITDNNIVLGSFQIADKPSSLLSVNDNIGLFVSGNDPFSQNKITSLSGLVQYNGIAILSFLPNKNTTIDHYREIREMYGNLVLRVNFGNSNELGKINGTISDFRVGLEVLISDRNYATIIDYDNNNLNNNLSGILYLEQANVGDSHSGFHEGNISGTLDGAQYNGKWGGQFYGNGASNGLPETVAGTMAAESNTNLIVSSWAADFHRIVRSTLNQGPGYLTPGQSQASPIDPQELASSFMAPGPALGDALGNSIGEQQVTGFSSVPGITFNLNGDSFVGITPGASLAASLNSFMAPSDWTIPDQWQFSLNPLHTLSKHGASLEQGKSLFHLASPQGWAASFHTQGVEVAYNPSEGPFTFTAGAVHEPDSLLGTQARGIFGSLAADTFYMGSRWQTDMGQWSLAASGEVGLVAPTVTGSNVIDGIDTLTTNTFALEVAREFNNGNTLRFSLSQPLRVAAGSMAYTFANGSQDGLVTGESHSASLTPSGRQLDFTNALDVPLGEGELSLGLTMSTQPGHRKGADPEVAIFTGYEARW